MDLASLRFESRRVVTAVAERLVLRMAAAAEPGLHRPRDRAPAWRTDFQRALDVKRAVLRRRDRQRTVLDRKGFCLSALRFARGLEPGLHMHAVAIGLVERLPATAKRGAEA